MTRYAIYYMPDEHSPLWQFGSSVLGYDAATGMDVDYPDHPLFQDPDVLGWTAGPRRYGFHATLKAPFVLAEGRSPDDLNQHLDAFASAQSPFDIDLKLAVVSDFAALVPVEPSAALHRLADDCVRAFDAYRAPLTPADRERRHPERLTPRELAQLDVWGYPYVFDDFRFHMTLSGSLDVHALPRFEPVLRDLFATVPQRTSIDAVTLFRQDDAQGRFRAERRFPFAGSRGNARDAV